MAESRPRGSGSTGNGLHRLSSASAWRFHFSSTGSTRRIRRRRFRLAATSSSSTSRSATHGRMSCNGPCPNWVRRPRRIRRLRANSGCNWIRRAVPSRCDAATVNAAVSPPVISRAGDWLGYPKGAWLIIGVEFWERFSFYGMLSILVLFLTANPARGGFGWSATEALALLGVYSFAMYAFPAVGGFFADRVLGRRRAVKVGATFMLIGQVMLASPVFLPQLLGSWHGAPLLQSLHALGEPLGRLRHSGTLDAAIVQHGALLDGTAGAGWLMQAYVAASVGFF